MAAVSSVTTHRAGCYNADAHGRAHVAAVEVTRLVREYDLDWFACVEAAGMARALRPLLDDTHRVYTGHGSTARSDSLLIVRRGIPARWKRIHNLATGGWERAPHNRRHGLHPGRKMVSARLGRRGRRYRVGVPHLPPRPHGTAGSPYALRGAAWRAGMAALGRIAERWDRRSFVGWVLAGDWNRTRLNDGMLIWLARVDADAKGRGIDYPVWSGVKVRDVRRVPAGGDHGHAVLFEVEA